MKAGVVTKRLSQIRTCLETRHDVKLEMGEMFSSTRICCFASQKPIECLTSSQVESLLHVERKANSN